ncbi:MAG: hypothetical protein WA159_02955 [Variovorax sp.]
MRDHAKEQAAVDARIKESMPRKGPWHVSKYTSDRDAIIYDEGGHEVARVCYPNRNANARLIAAAPDLLDLAKMVLEYVEMPQEIKDAANAAVAKATRGVA